MSIGTNVKITGEAEFKKSIKDINDSMKVLGTEMKLVASQFDKNDHSAEALTSRNKVLSQEVEAQKNKVEKLKEALQNASEKVGENDSRTQAWQRQLNLAQADLNNMERELRNNNAALDELAKKEEEAARAAENAGEKLKKPGEQAPALQRIGDALDAWKKKSEEASQKMTGLTGLKNDFEKLKEGVEACKEKHFVLAASMDKIKDGAQKMGDGIKSVASKALHGFTTALKDTAAAAGAMVGAIGTATVAAGKKLWDLSQDVAQSGDEVEKQSQKVGMSFESYQKWDYAMARAGTSMSNCSTGLKTLTNTFDDAQNGSKGAIEKFDRLGLSLDEMKGKSREEVFEATVKALQGVSDETEKAALANDLFGKSGQELMPLFNQSAEATHALLEEAEQYGMVMSDDAVTASASFEDSLSKLKGTMTGVKNNLVGDLLPGITQIMDGLSDLAVGNAGASESIRAGVTSVIETINGMLPQVVSLFGTVATAILEIAPSIIEALANGILDAIPQLLPVVQQVIEELSATLTSMLPKLLEAGMQIIQSLADGLLTEDNISALMTAAVSVITNLVAFLSENVDLLVESAVLCITTLVDGLLEDDNLSKLVTAALDIVVNLSTGLLDHLPELLHAAAVLITEMAKALLSYDWKTTGVHILKGVVNGVKSMFTEVKNLFNSVGRMMIDAIKNVLGIHSPSTVFEGIGRNLLEGLWNGIQNMRDWLIEKIQGLGGAIIDALKAVFGISSPSKVFADQIGKNLGLGIGVGFEQAMADVKNDMADAIPTDFDLPDPEFNFPHPRGFGGAAASYPAQTLSGGSGSVIVNLSLHIGEFVNNRQQDINQLVDEMSVALAAKMQREEAAYG